MFGKLFYTGPSIDSLHAEYAKKGRIDPRAPVSAKQEVIINAPAGRVWSVLSDPAGWPLIDEAIHDVELDGPVTEDTRFDWSNGKARMKSRFAVVDPERELTWTGTSMGAKAVHRHVLTADGDGRTRLLSEESMAGPFLTLLFPSSKLAAGMDNWLDGIRARAEETSAPHGRSQ